MGWMQRQLCFAHDESHVALVFITELQCRLLGKCAVDLAFNPVGKWEDVGVDTWLVLQTTTNAPAHHTGDVTGSILLTHQWST